MSDIDERLEEEIIHASRKSFDSQQAGINANFLMDVQSELESLRAELTAVTAERDGMREALIDTTASLVASVSLLERGGKKAAPSNTMFAQMLVDYKNSIDRARDALEGVTEPMSSKDETEFFVLSEFAPLPEPASPWRDIESAPRDGTPILCVKKGDGFQPEILHFENGVFGWLTDTMDFGCHPNRQPTHWMPLPEPPR